MKKIINKKFTFPIIIIFIVGILFGIIFLFFINELDKLIIKTEITEYLNLINNDNTNLFTSFITSFKSNFIYITVIWLVSITLVFCPILFFIIFYKGFLTGFMLSSFIMVFGPKGIIYSIIFMFPHEILNISTLITFALIMLSISYKIAKSTYKNDSINLRTFFKKIFLIYIIAIIIMFISSLMEIYFNYYILGILF